MCFCSQFYGIFCEFSNYCNFLPFIIQRNNLLHQKLYFSFPLHTASFWNITIQWTFHDDFTEIFLCLSILKSNWKNSWNQSVKKVTQMIWQNFSVLALKNVSKTFKSIWKPNPCMDPLEKKFYYIRIYSIFCWASPFHCEWPQLVTVLTSFDLVFEKKFKSLKYQ